MDETIDAEIIEVVICTYNNAALLEHTLRSVSEQNTQPELRWRVTVVDNNSSDVTAQVVERFQRGDRIPKLRYLFEPRQGLTFARLCAFSNATATWVLFVDDDNLLAPDFVINAAKFASSHPRCGAFGACVRLQENPASPLPVEWQPLVVSTQDWGNLPQRLPDNGLVHLIGAGLAVKREAAVASGWLDRQFLTGRTGQQLSGGEDIELVLLVRKAGYELWYNPTCNLRHIVPQRRATPEYLKRIWRGNAAAMTFLSGMYPNQDLFAIWLIGKLGRIVLLCARGLLMGLPHRAGTDVQLRRILIWAECRGRIDGLQMALALPSSERRVWFGYAKFPQ